jgi:hypothetical protein
LPAASGDWASSKAAYRFYDNSKVTAKAMLRPHLSKVKSRTSESGIILAVQDSTYLNLDSFRAMTGLDFVQSGNTCSHKGLVFHLSIAFSVEGEYLGLLGYKLFSRSEKREFSRYENNSSWRFQLRMAEK